MHPEETSLQREFETLSVSRRLSRSVSHKLRKKSNQRSEEVEEEEEDDAKGVSMKCLSLYGRGGGGCKVGVHTGDEFGDSSERRRSSSGSEEGYKGFRPICGGVEEAAALDCFSYAVRDKFWRKNTNRKCLEYDTNRKCLEYDVSLQNSMLHIFLPDDILEMCLVRLPLTSLMNARLVCKKWRYLTSTPRFLQMRRDGLYRTPWLFLFGAVKDGYCSGEIHALDVSQDRWHRIDSDILKGRFMFSVASIQDDIYVVGGCSSLTHFGGVDRSSFRTHKGVLVFSPLTKTWRKIASMRYARSMPILGTSEVSLDCLTSPGHQHRQERRFYITHLGGVSDVYEDPHRLSVRRQHNAWDESDTTLVPGRKSHKFNRQKSDQANIKGRKKSVMIAVGGFGSWDEPLDSGEIYDPVSNKWTEIQRLPVDFGVVCSGVICNEIFYVYSETDKLMGYDIERGYWMIIQTSPFPPRVHEYYPKLVSCSGRLFMLSVSWCEGEGQIGQRNKAVRKLWELDLMYLTWSEVSVHPDAPMDWNAAFVADRNLIFGVEMFKIFGQVLDFLTVCNVSDMVMKWNHISRNRVAAELDASSCMTKSLAVLHL